MSRSSHPLLKARRRHTIWAIIFLIPLVVFSGQWLEDGGIAHALQDWVGYALVIVCVLGRTYSSLFVGGKKNDVLVQEGMFSVVRNPLYLFSLIGVVGIGLQSGKFTLLALFMVAFLMYYKRVIDKEEAFLRQKFGVAYDVYYQSTPRWLPRWSQWHAPQHVDANPDRVLKTMLDALMFFVPLPLFELLEMLHDKGYLETYFNLP